MLPLPQLRGALRPEVSRWCWQWGYHGELAASGVLHKVVHVTGFFFLPPGSIQGHFNMFANVLLHLPLSSLVCSSINLWIYCICCLVLLLDTTSLFFLLPLKPDLSSSSLHFFNWPWMGCLWAWGLCACAPSLSSHTCTPLRRLLCPHVPKLLQSSQTCVPLHYLIALEP